MLDKRLATAAALYKKCDTGADIGTDHGLLPCEVLNKNICRNMICCDISEKALCHAREQIKLQNLTNRAVCVWGDGLRVEGIKNCGCISIMGMGGETISRILKRDKDCIGDAALVLSAHTDLPLVRMAVYQIGFHITREVICYDAGRYYTIFRADPGREEISEGEIRRGVNLEAENDEILKNFIMRRIKIIQHQIDGLKKAVNKDEKLICEAQEDIECYRKMLKPNE